MALFVGVLQIDLLIPGSQSLKEKRFVLSSIKKRLQNKFNLSIAEVDENDKWQRAVLGIALVGNEQRFLEKSSTQIMNFLYDQADIEVLDQNFQIF